MDTFLVELSLSVLLFAVLFILAQTGVISELSSLKNRDLLIILIPVLALFLTQNTLLITAYLKNKDLIPAQITLLIIGSLIKVWLVLSSAPLTAFLLVISLDLLSHHLVVFWVLMRRKLLPRVSSVSFAPLKSVIKRSFPLMISSIAVVLYMRVDAIMIARLTDLKQLGIYSVGIRIPEMLNFIPVALSNSLIAGFYSKLKLAEDDEGEVKVVAAHFRKFGRAALAITLLAMPVGYILIPFLYGNDYDGATSVFLVSLLALPAVFLGVARTPYLIAKKKEAMSAVFTILGLATNVMLNLLLIPKYGIIAASFSTLISQYVAAIVTTLFVRNKKIFVIQLKSLMPC